MKIKYYFITAVAITSCIVSACSPINSMEPFDDKQAAIVARSMMPPGKVIAYSTKPVHGSTKNSTTYESEQ